MRNELECVRDWAKGMIRNGSKPHAWNAQVKLIEAVDALLQDLKSDSASSEVVRFSDLRLPSRNRADLSLH